MSEPRAVSFSKTPGRSVRFAQTPDIRRGPNLRVHMTETPAAVGGFSPLRSSLKTRGQTISTVHGNMATTVTKVPDSSNPPTAYSPGPLTLEYISKHAPLGEKPHSYKLPIKTTHMQPYEEDALAKELHGMANVLLHLEQRKKQLALRSDFNLTDFYLMFDPHNTGRIDFLQWEQVFTALGMAPPIGMLRLAFRELDRDLDGILRLQEFIKSMGPHEPQYNDYLLHKKPYNDMTNFHRLRAFTPHTQELVVSLLRQLLDVEDQFE